MPDLLQSARRRNSLGPAQAKGGDWTQFGDALLAFPTPSLGGEFYILPDPDQTREASDETVAMLRDGLVDREFELTGIPEAIATTQQALLDMAAAFQFDTWQDVGGDNDQQHFDTALAYGQELVGVWQTYERELSLVTSYWRSALALAEHIQAARGAA